MKLFRLFFSLLLLCGLSSCFDQCGEQGEPLMRLSMDTCVYHSITADGIRQDIPFTCDSFSRSWVTFSFPMNDSFKMFYFIKHNLQKDSAFFRYKLKFSVEENCGYVSNVEEIEIDSNLSSIKGQYWDAKTKDSTAIRLRFSLDHF